jgi:DNA-binding MarR family transcriptional regulator
MNTAHDIAMYLRAAYVAMHRFANSRLAKIGVTSDQYVLLCVLAEGSAITQQDLARRSFSDPNTIRPMLKILESRGLVSRNLHPRDGRARTVVLTAKGLKACEKFNAASEPVRDRILAAFKPTEIPKVLDVLVRIAEAMDLPIPDKPSPQFSAPDEIKTPRCKTATRGRQP